MKNNMDEIDVLIKETLTQEETKFYNGLEEQNLFAMIFGLFKGENKWLLILMNITLPNPHFKSSFVTSALKNCTKQYRNKPKNTTFIIFMLSVSMLKVFAWMQMDKNAILRELKRLVF